MTFAHHYELAINWIVAACPGPDKFAHSYAGLTIWLLSALILRAPLRSAKPLLIVILLELANEAVDRVAHGRWLWMDTFQDMAATFFWPFVLTAALRWKPGLRG